MALESLIARNLVVFSLQLAVLLGVGGLLPRWLRLTDARLSLRYWQALQAAMLALLAVQLTPAMGIARPSGTATAEIWLGGWALVDSGASDWIVASRALLVVLAAGGLLRLIWILAGAVALRRYVRAATPLPELPRSVEDLEERLGCTARYLTSSRLHQPVTFGWRRPTVLLPRGFLDLQPRRQTVVICHELLHVQRRDWLPFLFEEALRTVFWFHPAVRYLLSRIDLAREQVIDAEVLRMIGGRRLYLEVLLSFARPESSRTFVPATTFYRGGHLGERVRAILAEPIATTRRRLVLALALLLIAGSAAGVAAWMLPLSGLGARPARVEGAAAPPAPTAAPLVYAVEGEVERPMKIAGEPPRYTERARKAGIQGVVILRTTIDPGGNVVDVVPLELLAGGLTEVAMEAVAGWRFEPARLAGRPVSVYYNVTINFRLQ